MKRKLEMESMRYLVDVSCEIDRTLAYFDKRDIDAEVKTHLQDVLHDLKACLLDAKDICRQGIASARLAG